MPFWSKQSGRHNGTSRLFFATDVHGSERCFRKFLNAAEFYDAKLLILGGDVAGKILVPVERTPSGWRLSFRDNEYRNLSDSDAAELEQQVYDLGMYPIRGDRESLGALESSEERERLFVQAALKQMERWMEIADERLAGTGVRCLMAPGNDDPWELDDVIRQSKTVEFAEGECIALDNGIEVITTGYSNETPWKTPREVSEDELGQRLEGMLRKVDNPHRLILVAHPPPRGSDLDQAPLIDADFRVQMDVGAIRMASVGSAAVREFIEEHQPMLALHGHVHESKGVERIGRTVCVNPGSEYADGVLCGAIVALRGDEVASCQLIAG